MVLLGKNSSEISRVGNFILCRDAFNTDAPPPSVKQHSKRSGGSVEGRNITLINTPHLFDPQLSAEELNQRVRECMTLCSPGPHVLMLVLQPDDFTETDRHRLNYILLYLSEEPREHILVVTTQTLQSGSREQEQAEEIISHNIITEWSKKYFKFNRNSKACALIEMLETMVIENEWSYLQWEEYEPPTARQQCEQTTAQKESEKTEKCQKTPSVNNEEKSMKSWSERLNLVVCGSEGSVKSSISDLILGEREFSAESRSVCVRSEAEVCGRLISLVELPALYSSQLSEEEVMRETLRCVSLCDPGVHAFLLILPEGRLTDEDKGELEKIQMIFGTKFRKHTIVLITQSSQNKPLDQDSESLVKTYGQTYHSISSNTEAEEVIQSVRNLLKENRGSLFTAVMYAAAQIEAHLKYKRKNKDVKQEISELKLSSSNQIQGKLHLVTVIILLNDLHI
uniref:AIG1-type G domain-containing protein n=1 Tax=Astyanax mexicanus TaxID=7994 RepID=A0A3B1J2M9_ASTMX